MQKLFLFVVCTLALIKIHGQDEDFLLASFKEHKESIAALAFSPSATYLAIGSLDKSLSIHNLETEAIFEVKDNYYPVRAMEFNGENLLFISSGSDIKLIDFEGNTDKLYQGNATHIYELDFAPERNRLTAGSFDKKVKVWNVASADMELTLEGHEKSALTAAFSNDELYIATGSSDGIVMVWNATNGKPLHSFDRHSGKILDVAFHPNSNFVASASEDKTIRLWDISKATTVKTYVGHDKEVLDIEFSPDGYFLYSASADGVVQIWEVSTAKKIYSYILHEGAVTRLAVSSNGDFVATSGFDGKVYLWQSAKIVVVEDRFADKILSEKENNDLFAPRQKGESKDDYNIRLLEADKEYYKLIDKYYELYLKSNHTNIPQ